MTITTTSGKSVYRLICMMVLMLASAFAVSAQSGETGPAIRGTVSDSRGNPIADALVTGIELPDSTITGYTMTDAGGRFELPVGDRKPDVLMAACTGYHKKTVSTEGRDSVAIVLEERASELDELVVTARPGMARAEGGKFSFSPLSLADKMPNGAMLMNNLPLLEETGGLLQMLSRYGTTTIWINGRDPMLPGNILMEKLRSTPTKNILRVEIITNPSAEMGHHPAGIINFIIKEQEVPVVGSVSAGLTDFYDHFSPFGSLFVNYSRNIFRISAYGSYQYRNEYGRENYFYDYKNQNLKVSNTVSRRQHNNLFSGGLNMMFLIGGHSSAGINFGMGGSRATCSETTQGSRVRDGGTPEEIRSRQEYRIRMDYPSLQGKLWYVFAPSSKFTLDSRFLMWSTHYGKTDNMYVQAPGETEMSRDGLTQDQRMKLDGVNGHVDISSSLSSRVTINGGYDIDHASVSDDRINTTADNSFTYKELRNSLFVSGAFTFSDMISLNLGFRGEFTRVDTWLRTTGEKNRNSYFDWLPNASLSFNFPSGSQRLQIAYSKDAIRPEYSVLNPFRIWTSSDSYSCGNPDLQPYTWHRVSLYYAFLNNYSVSLAYNNYTDQYVDITAMAPDATGTTVRTYANGANTNRLMAALNYSRSFFNGIWRMNVNASATWNRNTGKVHSTVINSSGWDFRGSFSSTVMLSVKHMLSCNVSYSCQSGGHYAWREYKPTHNMFLSFEKNFSWGGYLRLSSYNLLGFSFREIHDDPDYYYKKSNPNYMGNGFDLTFAYTFGNRRIGTARMVGDSDSMSRSGIK